MNNIIISDVLSPTWKDYQAIEHKSTVADSVGFELPTYTNNNPEGCPNAQPIATSCSTSACGDWAALTTVQINGKWYAKPTTPSSHTKYTFYIKQETTWQGAG